MPSLQNAYVQRSYRPVVAIFSAVALILLAITLTASAASATITITPKLVPIRATLSLVVGPQGALPSGLPGQVKTSTVAASVSAEPASQGTSVPAHAQGQVVLHNDSGAAQALASGTRLQSTSGVIVRMNARADVPAHGTTTVNVTADPLGESGNLAPGRLTIVALRPANQSLIYGQVVTALTGGTTVRSGTLGLDALTAASDQAKAKIRQQVGSDEVGHLRFLIPVSVSTQPTASTPSATYTVTVSMKLVEVTYPSADLDQRLRQELQAQLATDQQLVKIDSPTISAGDQPTSDSIAINIKAQGEAAISPTSAALNPAGLTGLSAQNITTKLTGNSSIKAVAVKLSPWWRQTAPDQSSRIHIQVVGLSGS